MPQPCALWWEDALRPRAVLRRGVGEGTGLARAGQVTLIPLLLVGKFCSAVISPRKRAQCLRGLRYTPGKKTQVIYPPRAAHV